MPTPIYESILDNLVTTLQGITTGAGYYKTVNRVERLKPGLADLPDPIQIYIDSINDKRSFNDAGDLVTHVATIALTTYLKDADDPDEALSKIDADITKALYADRTRGGYAIETEITMAVRIPNDNEYKVWVLVHTIDITYDVSYSDPSIGR